MKERAHARSLYITGDCSPARKLSRENSSMDSSGRGAAATVTAFLQDGPGASREVAEGEWGLLLDDVVGRPLEIGIRLSGGLLRAQAWVAPAGALDPHRLLHRNRLSALARYAHSAAGEVHVHAEIPEAAVSPAELDRLLVALVDAAAAVR
jgi:hypothetical protein